MAKRSGRLHALLLLALAGLVGLALWSAWRARHPRWNVLVVLADTLRPDHLGLFGYRRPTSPELDRFAAQALVFERFRTQAACTFPSVNALLTSRPIGFFLARGRHRMGIPAGVPTLASVLREAGYATCALSASGVVRRTPFSANEEGGFEAGFEEFDESCTNQAAACVNGLALPRLASLREPFFLYLHYMDPHQPFAPPPEHVRRFARPAQGLRDFAREGVTTPLERLPRGPERRAFLRPGELEQLLDLYDEEIAYLDAQLGRLFGALQAAGRAERTLVVVVSDHGESFLEHDEVMHCQSVYESETRGLLLLRLPGGRAGRVQAPAQTLDVMPTLLELLGLQERARGLAGRSLVPILGGAPAPAHVFSGQGPWRSVDDGRHKLIGDLRGGRPRLFDLQTDPQEQRDLGAQDPARVAALQATLQDWLARTDFGPDGLRFSEEIQERLRALGYIQ